MNTINITLKEYHNLQPFNIEKSNSNIEGNFFLYKNELLKSFISSKILRDSFTQDKYINLLTIKKYENILKRMEELLLPSSLITIENNFIGYTMPLLTNSKSLKTILQDPNVDFKIKIELLTKIGKLLEKLEQTSKGKFHIGDLHEDNILLTKDHQIKIIDIDSMSLNNGIYFPSKYIVESLVLEDFPNKYKIIKQKHHITKVHYDKNTDLYCYIIIILNTLANFKMHRLLESEFFDYIDYLETINLPYEFLDCISKIYSTSENTNPYSLLETLPIDTLHKTNHLAYTKVTGKPIIYLK